MLHSILYCAISLWLLTSGGNVACRLLFRLSGLKKTSSAAAPDADNEDSEAIRAGWIIGSLERLIIAVGLLAHSWEVLAAVIALKTVGRFKELDYKIPAEYFLVGSMFSLLWSVIITGAWMAYDHNVGSQLYEAAAPLLDQVDPKQN